jgi:hypothetical protein
MNDTLLLVEIFKSLGHLNNDVSGKLLAKICQADNLVKKFTTWGKFQNDVIILPRFGEFDELNNIGVVELAHNLDLLQDI